MTLDENKAALVDAHRSQDWEAAKRLSAERTSLKNKKQYRRCSVCGVRVSMGSFCKNGHAAVTCIMHRKINLSMQASKWIPEATA